MNGWQWNGEAFEPCRSVPLEDRGFRYGMAVFETVARIDGETLFLEEHLANLKTACSQCGFQIPETALQEVRTVFETLDQNGVTRIYVTADNRIFLLAETRTPQTKTAYSLAPEPTIHLPFPSGLKSANYWRNLAAVELARIQGHNEALLITPDGNAISACMANIFARHGDIVSTPSTDCGARPGIVRAWVLEQIPVHEQNLSVQDLERADELFLTSSWIGIMPVSVFRKPLPAPGPTSTTLAGLYRENIIAP